MRFVYVLPGWEGSVADYRVLRNAILRPNGLKVPNATPTWVTMTMQIVRAFLSCTEGLGITLRSGDHQPKDLSTTKSIST
ncbi:hypothetical protein ACS0TY_034411 [Phlomoides rotata]